MARSYSKDRDSDYSTVLSRATKLSGKLSYSDSLKIKGIFDGEIASGGRLYIDEGSVVRADISADSVTIGGKVEGNVSAAQRVELLSSASLVGDIKAPSVRIADGVVFHGKCDMIKDPDTVDIFAAPVDTLKKTVSSA